MTLRVLPEGLAATSAAVEAITAQLAAARGRRPGGLGGGSTCGRSGIARSRRGFQRQGQPAYGRGGQGRRGVGPGRAGCEPRGRRLRRPGRGGRGDVPGAGG